MGLTGVLYVQWFYYVLVVFALTRSFDSDPNTTGRTLDSASFTNTTGMTTEACIGFCDTQGFVYAGTEFAQECCMFFFHL